MALQDTLDQCCSACHNLTSARRPPLDIDGLVQRNLESQRTHDIQAFMNPKDQDYNVFTTSTALRHSAAIGACHICAVLWNGLSQFLTTEELQRENVSINLAIWLHLPLPVMVWWDANQHDRGSVGEMFEFFSVNKSAPGIQLYSRGVSSPQYLINYGNESFIIAISNGSGPDKRGLWPTFGPARPVARYSGSDACFGLIKSWIAECDTKHGPCVGDGIGCLPKRVIDVKSTGYDPSLYLSHGESAPYLTLSHCWGKKEIIRTLQNNVEVWQRGIPWALLSQTFRDVVTIARELSVQYVWIDSLCIVQDDANDWEIESAQMATVYRNSYLNVAATCSSDGDGGCFNDRPSSVLVCKAIDMATAEDEACNIFVRRPLPSHNVHTPFERDSSRYPLHTRAWVFQERLLSRRTVQFMDTELYWECGERTRCECTQLDQGYPASKENTFKRVYENLTRADQPEQSSELWTQLVTNYSKMHLTFDQDKLPAISGIAKIYQNRNLGTYMAGLWRDYLHVELLWHVWGFRAARRPSDYRAPSWSWVSVEGSIEYDFGGALPRNPISTICHVDVLDINCSLKGNDSTGQVTAGYIRLRGKLVQTSCEQPFESKQDNAGLPTLRRNGIRTEFYPDVSLDALEPSYCLRIRTVNYGIQVPLPGDYKTASSLVLQRVKNAESTFTRIGCLIHNKSDDFTAWWDGAEEQVITIL